jgi:hypothetical protein
MPGTTAILTSPYLSFNFNTETPMFDRCDALHAYVTTRLNRIMAKERRPHLFL